MRLALFTTLSLLAAPIAGAQSSDTASTDTTAARRKTVALDEVRVTAKPSARTYGVRSSRTATKSDKPLRDTPQSVSVVTRGLIADQAMASMSDVVRYVPGITMGQGEGHRDAPTIRGNSSTADFFVDGVRDDAQYLRDVYNVERIEALKGPNAMVFGRGGGGGVINRVTKEAGVRTRELGLATGSFDQRRGTVDFGGASANGSAARLNAMYERSGSFRDEVEMERVGVSPVARLALGTRTTLDVSYEHFVDTRQVDRGIPSFRGRPAPAPATTFFGDPDLSHSRSRVNSAGMTFEHATSRHVVVRNATRFARYGKFYQNVFPGAVLAGGSEVALSAYSSATDRANLFNQTDVTYGAGTGSLRHTMLVGAEFGRQTTGNFRRTGYFAGGMIDTVSFARPTVDATVEFRQSATDADNDVHATIGAVYAQDQVVLSSRWQAIVGVRVERFALDLANHRNNSDLRRADVMLSPRAGLIFKPVEPVSMYASFGVSHLPSAGDQFSSLNVTTSALEPERFTSYEVGAKWDIGANVALTSAVYRLDRTNTSARDPFDPSRTVQTGAQRTSGAELGITGSPTTRWQIAAGWAAQRAVIVSTTAAGRAGASVPLVPARTLSVWNRYDFSDAIGMGVGVVDQGRSYAAIDNSVVLPRFTRTDAALFVRILPRLRAQLNVENVGDVRYYPTSHGNNNILPGAPRLARLTLATTF